MQVVILAAGASSRFIPFNQTIKNKALISLMGKSIIEHTLLSVKRAGITDVVVVVPDKKMFSSVVDAAQLGMHIEFAELPSPLGMGEALLCAKEFLHDSFFVINANHVQFHEFAPLLLKEKKLPVLLGKKDQNYSQYGFMITADDRVTEVIEKPNKEIPNALRVIGIYLLNKEFLDVLEKTPKEHYSFETALSAFAKQKKLFFIETTQETLSLKYPWDLFPLKDYLLSQLSFSTAKTARIAKSAQILGDVYIGENVTIAENVVIKGPCFIDDDAYVGTGSLLRSGTIVEKGAVIGSYMEAKNLILMDKSTTHTGLLEDSIIGKNCKVAAEICTANVRLDRGHIFSKVKDEKIDTGRSSFGVVVGDSTQLGVRVTTMPGIIIGSNTIIGPDTVVVKNVAEKVKFFTKFEESITTS